MTEGKTSSSEKEEQRLIEGKSPSSRKRETTREQTFMFFKGRQLNNRISIVVFGFFLLWGILFLRGAYLQLFPNEKLAKLQNRLFDRTVTLKPRRGVIYDRHGRELAISIPSQSLFADPQRVKEPYYSAKKLSQLFGTPKKLLLRKLLNKKRRFVWLKRHLTEKEIKEIQSWNLKGLYFLKESKRFYTQKNSLSQVLGFTGVEGQGLEGIEKQYDEILKGEAQKVLIQRDARGRPLFSDFSPFISKVSGFDLYLTIDSGLQLYLERSLRQVVARFSAESAMGVILSAEDSEVLAMANIPNYDPHHPNRSRLSYRRNRTVTDMFEPGSTLKVFTVSSALKKGISLSKAYSSHEGKLKIGNTVIREADPKKKFKAFLSMPEILSLSSNVGAAGMALDVGSKNLRRTFWRFGFGRETGIDFPGEAKGLLRPLPWRPVETATISFGHGIAGTALQVANAYGAIANGGVLKKPLLVRQIRNPYTGEERRFHSQNIRRVLTPEQAQTLSLMLISVTEREGTGVRAVVPGYFVAGKTGTAQKVDFENKGYKQGEYITSFAGFIPAHKPKFVIYLVIDGARDNFYASSLAAPLFSQVASYSVRRAGLSPTVLEEENIILASRESRVAEPEAKRSPAKRSEKEFLKTEENASIPILFEKSDSYRREKTRESEQDQYKRKKSDRRIAFASVPDLQGMTLREALKKIQGSGLKFKIQGSGRLARSIPSAGKSLPSDRKITLIFN